ncbi:PfkB family carbohydrate kinase [Ferruginibacter sp. HRS2-29]|uniref:PfkB family carbohydrate kinase n=1 Tax=Ferruginibacter sp. HRS2-29 TaxID=2487334 RepID=UPI0020CBE9AF|nr:PfkB family carbohydrate kinase [Ferruginibacter sp. HRS2-29]MCP9749497.1 carbohydrate kinase [Ferruginibacter sp. HRS2-29]
MKHKSNPVCIGAGLVALDVIISDTNDTPTQFLAGGSCGNVNAILGFLGWSSYPIARLSKTVATELLLADLHNWKVNSDLISVSDDGSTPIIIHRILKDRKGFPKHRFEFRNPEDGKYLPSYKPCLAKSVDSIFNTRKKTDIFYFDRINRASIELAKLYKTEGAIIFFEPSSAKDIKGFTECLEVADIVKFSSDRITNYSELFEKCRVKLEIETLGEKGLQYRRSMEKKWHSVNGYSIDNLVDAAGAGDWCTAGVINTLYNLNKNIDFISNKEIVKSLRFGQALSALNCTYEGARGLMYNISRSEMLSYILNIVESHEQVELIKNDFTSEYNIKKTSRKISSLYKTL